MGSEPCELYPWYPMWSWSNNLSSYDEGGGAYQNMAETKHKYLPALVKSKNFESTWDEYMTEYEKCNPEEFFDLAQQEVDNRLAQARANGYQG